MTLKEAKKILKKEGFVVDKIGKPRTVFDFFIENEAPDICEAMQVVSTDGYDIYMEANRFDARKARLKKEHEENTKDPDSVGEQTNEGNSALAESASQFNDALLDEQADKIKRLGKEITLLNKAIHKKNMKIEELRKESSRHLRGKIKVFYENVDLEKMLKDKDAVLADVAEELRLSKIREKNLTEVSQKYMKENEELKKKLANKIVDKIDAQTLKSAESALAYKEKVIAEKDEVIADLGKELNATKTELDEKTKLVEELTKEKELLEDKITIFNIFKKRNDKAYQRQIRSLDKEISDLGNELAATKKELEEKTNLVEMVRKGSKEYREYGIAALSMIRKMAKVIVNGGPVSSKDYKEYRRLANGYSFNPQLPDFSEEEEKKLSHVKNDNSHGEVTNQKDISPSLKITVRLLVDDVRDLFKNMQHLW